MSKLFNKEISPACKYCVYSSALAFSNDMICKHQGITDADNSCRRYKYDPLKREPKSVKIEKNYTKSDFEI